MRHEGTRLLIGDAPACCVFGVVLGEVFKHLILCKHTHYWDLTFAGVSDWLLAAGPLCTNGQVSFQS